MCFGVCVVRYSPNKSILDAGLAKLMRTVLMLSPVSGHYSHPFRIYSLVC